jgi:hypothetical protein
MGRDESAYRARMKRTGQAMIERSARPDRIPASSAERQASYRTCAVEFVHPFDGLLAIVGSHGEAFAIRRDARFTIGGLRPLQRLQPTGSIDEDDRLLSRPSGHRPWYVGERPGISNRVLRDTGLCRRGSEAPTGRILIAT